LVVVWWGVSCNERGLESGQRASKLECDNGKVIEKFNKVIHY
jgi:hypothetical protein